MFVTIVAFLCLGPLCTEEIVTTSDQSEINWQTCQLFAQHGIAEWLKNNPKYHNWTLQKWRCIPGHYSPGGRA